MAFILVACTEEPPPAESAVQRPSDSAEAVKRVEAPGAAQFIVYFGSFDDGTTAFRYAFELPGASVKRTAKGRYLIVTEPMDRPSAHELAEWTGGRALTTDDLRKLMDGS